MTRNPCMQPCRSRPLVIRTSPFESGIRHLTKPLNHLNALAPLGPGKDDTTKQAETETETPDRF
jgi:hypothetical protein